MDHLAQLWVRTDSLVLGEILHLEIESFKNLVDEGDKSVGFWNDDSNETALSRIAVDKDLLNKGNAGQDPSFDVLCSNVLSLTQLHTEDWIKDG